jgi:hypothetical protein
MLALLNGAVGYWDELAIALVALAVLWIAVRLAGRNPAHDEDDEESASETELSAKPDKESRDPPQHSTMMIR